MLLSECQANIVDARSTTRIEDDTIETGPIQREGRLQRLIQRDGDRVQGRGILVTSDCRCHSIRPSGGHETRIQSEILAHVQRLHQQIIIVPSDISSRTAYSLIATGAKGIRIQIQTIAPTQSVVSGRDPTLRGIGIRNVVEGDASCSPTTDSKTERRKEESAERMTFVSLHLLAVDG